MKRCGAVSLAFSFFVCYNRFVMADEKETRRHGLHAVKPEERVEPDRNFRAEIRSHRMHVFLRWIIFFGVVVAAIWGILFYFANKKYTGFEVLSETERADTAAGELQPEGEDIPICDGTDL